MNEPCFYRVSVKALIVDQNGKFLLAKESDGTWDLLGGGLDHDEDPVAALKREITEEAGLTVTEISRDQNTSLPPFMQTCLGQMYCIG